VTGLHRGLETEKIFEALVGTATTGQRPDPTELGALLEEKDRRLLFEILFESFPEPVWETAENCLDFLRNRQDSQELAELDHKIQAEPPTEELVRLLRRQTELRQDLSRKRSRA